MPFLFIYICLFLQRVLFLINWVSFNVRLIVILKVFQDGELTHYVDGAGDQRNWMKYVNCARHDGEQNLVLVQEDGEVFYEVCKEVPEGCELLVWYGDTYLKYMGIPITMKTKLSKIENDGGLGKYTCCSVQKSIPSTPANWTRAPPITAEPCTLP